MTTDSFNSPIDVAGLPQLPVESFEPLAPNYLRARYVGDAIFAMVVVVVGLVVTAVLGSAGGPVWIPLTVMAVLLGLLVVAIVLQTLSIRHLGYLVREHDLSYRRGVISQATQTIPYNRVQHVGLDRGPVERFFGLATLQLRSAGGVIGIEGLAVEDANRLKALVVARAGVDEAHDRG